jgi:hypothetical protein
VTEETRFQFERGGYLDSNGTIGMAIGSGRLSVPKWVILKRGCIYWKGDWRAGVEPSREILDQFIELWEANDDGILSFARAYGTLRRPVFLSRELKKTDRKAREPLSRWRSLSGHVWGLLHIASNLGADEQITFEEWSKWASRERMLSGIGPSLGLGLWIEKDSKQLEARTGVARQDLEVTRDAARKEFQEAVNLHGGWKGHARRYLGAEIAAWNTKLGPISFGIERDDEARSGWKTVLDFGGSLPCYLGLQLMTVIARGSVFTCSACCNPYIRERRREGMRKLPKPGERNYCQSDKCKRECNRLAVERKRERDRMKGDQQ